MIKLENNDKRDDLTAFEDTPLLKSRTYSTTDQKESSIEW